MSFQFKKERLQSLIEDLRDEFKLNNETQSENKNYWYCLKENERKNYLNNNINQTNKNINCELEVEAEQNFDLKAMETQYKTKYYFARKSGFKLNEEKKNGISKQLKLNSGNGVRINKN